MKRTLLIICLAITATITVSSCVSSRNGGCKSTQGFSGYSSTFRK